jgi:hypothetical protein
MANAAMRAMALAKLGKANFMGTSGGGECVSFAIEVVAREAS